MDELQRGEQGRHEGQKIFDFSVLASKHNQGKGAAYQDLLMTQIFVDRNNGVKQPSCRFQQIAVAQSLPANVLCVYHRMPMMGLGQTSRHTIV